MDLQKTKNLFLKSMIACLIAAATLAVVTVLLGQFNEVFGRALFTILLIALHSLLSFGFIVNNEKQETFENLQFFTNATFVIIIFSFLTSIFGVWTLLPGEVVLKLYGVYFVFLFAVLHAEVIAKAIHRQTSLASLAFTNYIFMGFVVVMLMFAIFLGDSEVYTLGPVFYRILAALGIIDATMTLVIVILHKLYLQKHPLTNDNVFNIVQVPTQITGQPATQVTQIAVPEPKRGTNIFVKIIIGYVVLQIVGGIFMMLMAAVSFH